MHHWHGSREPHGALTAVLSREYEDHLDWIENHRQHPALTPLELHLLLQLAALATGISLATTILNGLPAQ